MSRGPEEVGVRIIADERYEHTEWDEAKQYLSVSEQEEFDVVEGAELGGQLSAFWENNGYTS